MQKISRQLASPRPVDALVIERYKSLSVLQPHNYFDEQKSFRATQMSGFFRSEIKRPILARPKAFRADLPGSITPLKNLLQQVSGASMTSDITTLYQKRIQELIDGLQLVQASKNNDWETWKDLNTKLYGTIDRPIFWGLYGYFQTEAKKILTTTESSKEQQQAAKYFLSQMPVSSNVPLYRPPKSLMQQLRLEVQADLQALESLVGDTENFNADEVCLVFERVFKKFGIDHEWSVQKNTTTAQAMLRVNRKNRSMMIPTTFSATRKKLLAILVHEVGISPRFAGHIMRSYNGSQSQIALLGEGLDRYNIGEEGVCILWEQLLSGKYVHERKMLLYFLLGFITGEIGKKPSFKQVYDLVYAYQSFRFPSVSNEQRQKKSYNICMRVFRGTDTSQAGLAFMKDKIYLEGNMRIWQLLDQNPNILESFSFGSFNPLDQTHWNVIKTFKKNPSM
jgi:hypothetical protein